MLDIPSPSQKPPLAGSRGKSNSFWGIAMVFYRLCADGDGRDGYGTLVWAGVVTRFGGVREPGEARASPKIESWIQGGRFEKY